MFACRRLAFAAMIALAPHIATAASAEEIDVLLSATLSSEKLSLVRDGFGRPPHLEGDHDNEVSEVWSRAAEGRFDVAEFLAAERPRLAAAISSEDARGIVAFYKSPLGKRAAVAELKMIEIELALAAKAGQAAGGLEAVEEQRLDLYLRLARAGRRAEWSYVSGVNFRYVTVAAMVGVGVLPRHLTDRDIAEIVEAQSGEIRASAQRDALAAIVDSFRDFGDDDLRAYIEFRESPAMQAVIAARLEVHAELRAREARSFGHRLLVLLGARRA